MCVIFTAYKKHFTGRIMGEPLELNDLKLSAAFEIVFGSVYYNGYITEIAESIYNGKLDKSSIKHILKRYKIFNIEDIKEELLDLILTYIRLVALRDNLLTDNELNNVRLLKILFEIKEGDFYQYRKDEINQILKTQLYLIYRDDDKINDEESILKNRLQQLFDLGYDQFLKYANKEDIEALDRGANYFDLDTFISLPFNDNNEERIIPQDVKNLVWNRESGKCRICGSNKKLEFDHIVPFSKGGSNTYRNIQLLCESCNRKKSANIE